MCSSNFDRTSLQVEAKMPRCQSPNGTLRGAKSKIRKGGGSTDFSGKISGRTVDLCIGTGCKVKSGGRKEGGSSNQCYFFANDGREIDVSTDLSRLNWQNHR